MMDAARWEAALEARDYRFLTDADVATIISMYRADATIQGIGDAIGRSPGTVGATIFRLRKRGMIVGRGHRRKYDHAQIVALRAAGNSYRSISKQVGCSRNIVIAAIRQSNAQAVNEVSAVNHV